MWVRRLINCHRSFPALSIQNNRFSLLVKSLLLGHFRLSWKFWSRFRCPLLLYLNFLFSELDMYLTAAELRRSWLIRGIFYAFNYLRIFIIHFCFVQNLWCHDVFNFRLFSWSGYYYASGAFFAYKHVLFQLFDREALSCKTDTIKWIGRSRLRWSLVLAFTHITTASSLRFLFLVLSCCFTWHARAWSYIGKSWLLFFLFFIVRPLWLWRRVG